MNASDSSGTGRSLPIAVNEVSPQDFAHILFHPTSGGA